MEKWTGRWWWGVPGDKSLVARPGDSPSFFLVFQTCCPFLRTSYEARECFWLGITLLTRWGRWIQEWPFKATFCVKSSCVHLSTGFTFFLEIDDFLPWRQQYMFCLVRIVLCSVLLQRPNLLHPPHPCSLCPGISPSSHVNPDNFLPVFWNLSVSAFDLSLLETIVWWWLGTAKWVSSCSLVTSSQKVFQNVDVVSRVIFQASKRKPTSTVTCWCHTTQPVLFSLRAIPRTALQFSCQLTYLNWAFMFLFACHFFFICHHVHKQCNTGFNFLYIHVCAWVWNRRFIVL